MCDHNKDLIRDLNKVVSAQLHNIEFCKTEIQNGNHFKRDDWLILENHAKVIKVAEEKIIENEVRMSMEETSNSE
jgi:hypothetical protein